MKTLGLFGFSSLVSFCRAVLVSAAAMVLAFPVVLLAQTTPSGYISFGNVQAPDAGRIWVIDENGNLIRAPSGSPSACCSYFVALYWGPLGTPEEGLVRVGAASGFITGGQFSGGGRTLSPLAENGGMATVQVRGWALIPGIENTYEAVLAAAQAGDTRARLGKGPVFDTDTYRMGDPADPARSLGQDPNWNGFVISAQPPTYSFNAVGYYTVDTPGGWYFVANQLNYRNNLLDEVLPLPDSVVGTHLRKWDAQQQRYNDMIDFVPGYGWYSPSDPAPALRPGEGGLMFVASNGVPTAMTLTFVGEIAPRSCATIYAGWNLRSLSLGGNLSEISPRDGDGLFLFDMLGQAYRDTIYYFEGFGWFDSSGASGPEGPRIPVGQSFLLLASETRNPCVIEAAGGGVQSISSTSLVNPVRSGSTFSFEFTSTSGRSYQVEMTDTYPGTWRLRGAPMAGTGQTIQYTDTTATNSSRYYRLLIK